MPAFEPVTKFNATIDDVSRFPDMVRQAFRVAVSGTPGPVHLQFRGNEGQLDAERGRDGAACARTSSRACRRSGPLPEDAHVRAALDAAAGGGATGDRRRRWRACIGRRRELVALAEALEIPVATSLNGKDSIPGTHPLSVGVSAAIRARAPTASSTRPTSSASSAARPAA